MTNEVKLGIYKHYKGTEYKVLGCAKHSETGDELIMYKSLSDGKLWARPKEMFLELVKINDKDVPRFQFVSD